MFDSDWKNIFKTQILSNFTVYDFEEYFPTINSIIFRKYLISDSLKIPFNFNIIFGIYGRLEIEDKGNFFKKEYAQNILQSTQSTFYDFFFKHNFHGSLLTFKRG